MANRSRSSKTGRRPILRDIRTQGGASLCPGLSPCAPLGQKTNESLTMNQQPSDPGYLSGARSGSHRCSSRNHSRPAVTPGQSSVRNGVNGKPLVLNMLQTGLSAQAYRTDTGLGTLGLETRTLFPSTILATAG